MFIEYTVVNGSVMWNPGEIGALACPRVTGTPTVPGFTMWTDVHTKTMAMATAIVVASRFHERGPSVPSGLRGRMKPNVTKIVVNAAAILRPRNPVNDGFVC